MAKYKPCFTEIIVLLLVCAGLVTFAWAARAYYPEMDIDMESLYDLKNVKDAEVENDLTVGGDTTTTNLTASATVEAEHIYSTDDIYANDTITGTVLTDGTFTTTGGVTSTTTLTVSDIATILNYLKVSSLYSLDTIVAVYLLDSKIAFQVAGAEQVYIVDGTIMPTTDNDIDLGSDDLKFGDMYGKDLTLADFSAGGETIDEILDDIIHADVLDAITVTDEGGVNISWTSGEVWDYGNSKVIDTDSSGSTACTAASINYLYWDRSGGGTALTLSTTAPDASDNDVAVATINVAGGDIHEINEIPIYSKEIPTLISAFQNIFPSIVTSGLVVSEHTGDNAFDVDMTEGVYYVAAYGKSIITAKDSTTDYMDIWYKSGATTWTQVSAQTEIYTTQWNSGTSLTGVTANKYYRTLFFVDDDGINAVVPTAEYDTVAQAIAGADQALPAGLTDHPKSTAVILRGNDAAFPTAGGERWIDRRPILGGDISGDYSDHGNLAGLSDDDHTKYFADTTIGTRTTSYTTTGIIKAEHLYTTDDMYVTDQIQDKDGLNGITVAQIDSIRDTYVAQDGTRALTANWDVGAFNVTAQYIYSDDQVYSEQWDGELSVPTKNAVYDKIEALTLENMLASIATGDLIYRTLAGIWGVLARGTENQILAVKASGELYYVDMPSGGGGTTIDADQINAANQIYTIGAASDLYTINTNILLGDIQSFGVDPFPLGKTKILGFEPPDFPPTEGGTGISMVYGKNSSVYDTDTKLMLHYNGVEGATTAPDSSQSDHTMTFYNTTEIDTDLTDAFGGNAGTLWCDGNSDYIDTPDSSDWALGGNDFTIDFWMYFNGTGGQMFWGQRASSSVSQRMELTATSKFRFYNYNSGFVIDFSSDTLSLNTSQWYHIALVREGSDYTFYLDGVDVGTKSDADALVDVAGVLWIGTFNGSLFLNGQMDEFRWSNGVARWSTGFTPETFEYTGTLSAELAVMDESGNETVISPHKFKLFKPQESSRFPWSYYSQNTDVGIEINVDMYRALKDLEVLTGNKYIYEKSIGMTKKLKPNTVQWVKDKREKEIELRALDNYVTEEPTAVGDGTYGK